MGFSITKMSEKFCLIVLIMFVGNTLKNPTFLNIMIMFAGVLIYFFVNSEE